MLKYTTFRIRIYGYAAIRQIYHLIKETLGIYFKESSTNSGDVSITDNVSRDELLGIPARV
jgi:hypothetical protein